MLSSHSLKINFSENRPALVRAFVCWLVVSISGRCTLPAAEPYEKFLLRMREERYYDLALLYLDDIEKRSDLESDFQQVIELERALLFSQSASQLPQKSPQRAELLNQSEAALHRFVDRHPKHIRRSEARLKLGGLLQLRAEEVLAAAGSQGDQDVPEAVRFFDQAHQLYESIVKELAELESTLRGGRIDTSDPKQVAHRDRVIAELREAQLLSAKAVENRGRSRAKSSPERKSDLQQARKMFTDLYNQEKSLIGIRNYALFFRSGIFQSLEQLDDAVDGYQRIVDLENIDALRSLQTESVTELSKVLAAQGKYELAIERATRWLDGLQTAEKASNEAVLLGLELARIQIDYAEQLRSADGDDRNALRISREARDALRAMLRTASGYQDRIKLLLGRLGAENTSTVGQDAKLPVVKSLAEAIEECQKRIDDAASLVPGMDAIDEQLGSGQLVAERQTELEKQRSELQQQVDGLHRQAASLIHDGLTLFRRDADDRAALGKARLHLAYLHLQLDQPYEAIVIGDFLCRTTPGTPQGLEAARIVLNGYFELSRQEGSDQMQVLNELAPFAEFLVANWPQSSEAASVSSSLTQLAILSKDWEAAERYLQIVPESDPTLASHYFRLGAALFDQFQQLQKESPSDQQRLDALRDRSIKWLKLAASRGGTEEWSLQLGVRNALALLWLSHDQVEEAEQALISADTAPMRWLSSKIDQVAPEAAMDACRTAMRIVASKVAMHGMSAADATRSMQEYVNLLQEIASRSDDGPKKLQGIFASIARDLKEKLSLIKEPAQRDQVSSVVLLVMKEAAKSESFATQYWAASSMLSIAEEVSSKEAFETSAELLAKMSKTASQQPDWAQPEGAKLQLKVMLAQAAQGAEDFRTALLTYSQILDENENLLDVQIDVARLLQRMGSDNPARLNSAIQGARPRPRTGNNVFWGWGKISQVTSRKLEKYSQQFFESRYQLANCRWMIAASLKDPASKEAELARAQRALTETTSLYPALGGPDDVQRYAALLSKINQELEK